ncbi:MAG: ABC transporter ATP-binding protein [Ignavibacteriales bacterium]
MTFAECRGLTKAFGGVVAVKDLSFTVEEGEILGLIGPNGAGKTTVFNLITGFYKPTSGSTWFQGEDITGFAPPDIVVRGVARTFQNIRLFGNLSVLDNIRTALYRHATYGLGAAILRNRAVVAKESLVRDLALKYLDEVGLADRAGARASSLPYGLQRKLEIARALALAPRLLLLDEPAAGMNPEESLGLVDLIAALKAKYGFTIILIEHHMDVVMRLCRRIVVMNFGRKLMMGTPEEVQSDPEVVKAYLGEEFARARHR